MKKGITDIDEGTLRRVDWRELLPATTLVRAFSFSIAPFAVFLCTLLVAACVVFVVPGEQNGKDRRETALSDCSVCLTFVPKAVSGSSATCCLERSCTRTGFAAFFVFLFAALVFARKAAVQLASTERVSLLQAFGFALRGFLSVLLALALQAVLLGILCAASAILAYSIKCGILTGVLYPLFILTGLVQGVVLLVAVCSLPLVVAAVAVDDCDGFDALSRAVSYVTQRPFHFAAYVLLAAIPGALGWAICESLVWYAGQELLVLQRGDGSAPCSIGFWNLALACMSWGYLFYYSVVASDCVYFMLRRSVDGTMFDVCHTGDMHKPSRKLQPIVDDAQGAPLVPEPTFSSKRPGEPGS